MRTGICCVLVALVSSPAASQSIEAAIERDPFRRPQRIMAVSQQAQAAVVAEEAPDLRAIIYDGQQSLANVNGVILGIGDEWKGYRLVQIREHEAVLTRRGRSITLSLDRISHR